ncbi:conserved hypothetical protein [Theileria orientalis strain Shintoku]|uniref:Uncharacterized protein n=1 Tax=Theileria orientalis strain Shintoku TaxID=869250 RepID=J4C7J1_THEOR|nr:conserved hypothetical protein [Theileria orientalis strain Shintoku]BAM39128.1 conserved hypothetical protein [Theileria orientalis strain Shintoku]|eukprot:XP_009689429.1 conserved hypothetical protein [Theileria orientalis strain Shintoku]
MVTDEDFIGGIKISESPRNVWDRIKRSEKSYLCLNCERHRWKNKDVKLCDKCYRSCSREKCVHCKSEFSFHKFCEKAAQTYKRHVCLNCARNIATHNTDPRLCRFCSCWSAWRETSECDRCFALLERFGNPTNCESCNKNCYFNKGEESRSKVDGLKLCYLCTYDFKKNDYYTKRRLLGSNNHANSNSAGPPGLSNDGTARNSDTSPGTSRSNCEVDLEKEYLRDLVAKLEKEVEELKLENERLKLIATEDQVAS